MEHYIFKILDDIKSLIQGKISNQWIDIHQVSKYASVSQSTIRRAVKTGKLVASKETGKLLFKISSVERWLNG